MTTLEAGIASYEKMKARTMRIARWEQRIWFTSTGSFAKGLLAGNRDLLRVIPKTCWRCRTIWPRHRARQVELVADAADDGRLRARASGARGERGRIAPKVGYDRVELELPLTQPVGTGR